jgi:C4-dicarboxylate transporter DctM subunit
MDVNTAIQSISVVVVLLFVLGTPVILCIGLWVSGLSWLIGDYGMLANIGQASFGGLQSFALLAMPLFILTGDIALRSGIASAITRLSRSLFGRVRGSTAITTLVASGAFAALSGSNAATTATIGSMMHPEMKKEGYESGFSAAICAAGGSVGIIIPPSVLFIVYGVLVSVSVGDLFVAGILPGILMVIGMVITAYILSRRNRWGDEPVSPSVRAISRAAWDAKHAFLAVVFAIGGIYLGVFSPTEAAGITVAYLAVATVVTRKIRLRDLPQVMKGSAEIIGVLGPLIAFSVVLQQAFSFLGVDERVRDMLSPLPNRELTLAIMAIIFVSGMILESLPNVIIWAPILAPLAEKAGFDPVHFGVVFMVGIAIGFVTPPYGLNLFVASGITNIPYTTIARRVIPFVVALLIVWALVIVFPPLSLWLVPKH